MEYIDQFTEFLEIPRGEFFLGIMVVVSTVSLTMLSSYFISARFRRLDKIALDDRTKQLHSKMESLDESIWEAPARTANLRILGELRGLLKDPALKPSIQGIDPKQREWRLHHGIKIRETAAKLSHPTCVKLRDDLVFFVEKNKLSDVDMLDALLKDTESLIDSLQKTRS